MYSAGAVFRCIHVNRYPCTHEYVVLDRYDEPLAMLMNIRTIVFARNIYNIADTVLYSGQYQMPYYISTFAPLAGCDQRTNLQSRKQYLSVTIVLVWYP